MSMTITEKILAKAAGKKKVSAGEIVEAKIDIVRKNRMNEIKDEMTKE